MVVAIRDTVANRAMRVRTPSVYFPRKEEIAYVFTALEYRAYTRYGAQP